ncbi:hypothetical protein [uncultured Sphingomonas sp.]|uniref:hypothetical protein n=1 Tax=uncultured Sphingomonas sp. TaxID=158754 RepID=UPI0025DE71C5|nr:hypothetical protein [uncultured Sphingomonas sp.]
MTARVERIAERRAVGVRERVAAMLGGTVEGETVVVERRVGVLSGDLRWVAGALK